jgi:hypothetical protein
VLSHGAFSLPELVLFTLSCGFAGIGRRSERRVGHCRLYFALIGFRLFLFTIASGHLSLLLRRLTTGTGQYAFHGVPSVSATALGVSTRAVWAQCTSMLKGIEKMERSARYIARLQKDGQYTVVMSRPEWANREIPGFSTEAAANACIAGRRQQSKL